MLGSYSGYIVQYLGIKERHKRAQEHTRYKQRQASTIARALKRLCSASPLGMVDMLLSP